MTIQPLNTESLLRQVIASVAQLPQNDLLVVYEIISDLKQKDKSGISSLTPDEILSRAKLRASELKHLPHAESVQRFIEATERVRDDAIDKGTAIEGEWESD
jgi:hypothetical protein